ncbi:filamentous hemagglutinin N-terminal domain-containing protein [Undibacterium piscinae]|uniref:Filamentous hemagglutinin N-terminal domain-containing protein n=1 Tax=Undibacterium piscinae TaxID=2495591 RepID=A0A6M4A6I6_9BURK|nr:filamentous hemagglutinin N-terminal domain-containing protein [Undibacterium piscinae]
MNKIHRVIWNEHTGTWVAVAETAKGRGKGSGRAARKAMLAALLASGLSALPALAELASTTAVPASGKTNAYISANGVPVVNIETANAKGLSHNKFTRYDVETKGVVLNNGNNSLVSRQSQLAGQVISNLNLVQEAKIILNEVVSTNRSTLAGFTEVLGGKADVIVANPNGISCNGCGFINTDRVTLTTGTSNIAADGSLNGFNVNRGDVLIEGLGANASSQQILDIVARSVKVNGKINTLGHGSLGITTGSNSWNYADRSVGQPLAGEGAAPAYALDSTTLGGMYAGRIRIIATEAGVGVRMAGDAAASADDFSINSAGKIELQSAISAARDASINSSSNSGIQDVFLNGSSAKVSAKHDLAITTAGQLKLSEAELYAANQLALSAASLSDTSSAGKMRFAGGNSKLAITGNATIDGAVWGAGQALSGNFGSLTIAGGSATLYAGSSLDLSATGNLNLATAAVRANNDLTLTSSGGNISTSAGATQGIQSSSGTLRLNAGNGINNAGTMTADAGSLILRSNANVLNSGTIHAAGTLDIADQNNGSTENFTNTGSLLADTNITAKAANFINTGNLQATAGISLQANSLNNSGTLTGSTTAGKSASLNLNSLDNSGTLQSQEDLNINIGGSLSNRGKLLATHDLNIAAANSALVVSNSASGVIQAGNALSISASKATFDTQAGTVLANDISLALASLNNSGTVQANNAMQLAIGNALINSGVLLAKAGLNSNSASLDNSGTLQATRGASISTGVLNNSGKLIASDSASHAGLLSVSSLNNSASGVIQSAQNLNITLSGASLSNSGKIIAADDLNLTSTGGGLSVNNQTGAYLQAGNTSGDSLNLGGTPVSLNNAANAYMLGDQLSLNLASLNNAGTIQGGTASSSISSSAMLSNSGVLTLATGGSGDSNISAGTLTNSGTLQSTSGIAINVSNALSNDGTLLSADDLTVHSASLSNTGTLQANQGSNISTGALSNSGKLLVSTSASYGGTLNVATLSNTGSGVIQSAQDLNLKLSGNSLNNAGKLIAADDLNIASNGSALSVTNQSGAYLQAGNASGDRLHLAGTAITLNNNAGASLLGDQLDLSLASLNNGGNMQAGNAASSISASGDISNTGTLNLASTAAGSGSITANSLSNNGTLQSAGAASITVANTLTNNANLLIGGALTVRGSDTFYTLNNNSRLQSGGLMDLSGNGGGNGMDLTLGNNAILLGDSVYLNLGTLSIGNNGMLSSDKGMTINANSLSFGGSAARIVAVNSGSGSASIRLANSFSNNGAVHSSGDLTFSASSVSNSNTGGYSALNNLTLIARDGNLYNAGALYAGNQLTASTPATFTNAAISGTIDSDRDISITANTFVNDHTVTAGRDIRISANTFRNEVAGGDTRAWTAINWGSDVHDSTDNYKDGADDKQTQYWHRDGESHQYYQGGQPGFKPQIIAANSLSIVDFSNAYNTGGVISGSTVNLSSAISGAQFTNNDLALNRKSHKNTWEIFTHWIALGPATYDDHVTRNNQSFVNGESQISNIGAGIFASNLNASGFALVNQGSALSVSTKKKNESGASGSALGGAVTGTDSSNGTALGGTVNGANLGSGVAGVTNAQGKPAIHFGGLLITLPSNPNGYFVPNLAPGSKYLVETNPLFHVSSNYVGSDYMAQRYGYNPDSVIKRLGDANYEAYLIRQQLINQTGSNILKGYGNEAGQMQRLMDQALAEGKRAGFTFGAALSADQIKNLQEDVVWMVETTVAGQKVLAPVVYLSSKTRDAIVSGAVISGDNVKMNLSSLSNTGGTISGSESLSVVSKGDISNTSGTITGGNVSLTSTEGSIRNETLAKGDGNSENYATVIGKTAGISATGNLSLDAKQDIIVKGADVDAKGNASLAAGGNVTFDTIVDKTTDTTHSSSGNLLHNTRSSTTTTTENNLGSKLNSGGNLSIKSGGDTTIAGSSVDVKGDLAVDTGGSFNVIARQDKTTVHSEETTSGLGVGGGLAGKEKVTTDSFKGTNFGSTLNVGGNATIKAEKEMVVQGSNVDIKGDAEIDAKKGISILDGLNEERTTTRTETTTYLKMDNAGEKKSGAKTGDSKKNGDLYASAEANADAGAGASGTSDLKLSEVTTSTTRSGSNTSVASNFKVNGNLKAKTDGKLTVQGSNVESGGDMTLEAKEIAVLAGRNETWSNTETTTTSVGIYNEGDASAKAGANGQAKAGTIGTNASGEAKANAEAGGTTTFGARTENEKTSEYKLTNSGSSLKSGGKMKIAAENTALFVGADVHADGNLDISGKDIVTLAAQDIELKSSSKTTHTAGRWHQCRSRPMPAKSVPKPMRKPKRRPMPANEQAKLFGDPQKTAPVAISAKADTQCRCALQEIEQLQSHRNPSAGASGDAKGEGSPVQS